MIIHSHHHDFHIFGTDTPIKQVQIRSLMLAEGSNVKLSLSTFTNMPFVFLALCSWWNRNYFKIVFHLCTDFCWWFDENIFCRISEWWEI